MLYCHSFQINGPAIDRFRVENNTVKASEMMEMIQKCGYEIDFDTHWSLVSNMSSSCKEKKTTGQ